MDMSKSSFTVRYDGPILSGHTMDVGDLAPALLGLSDLCKLANRKFNGDHSAVKVLISTDLKHQCFQFNLSVVQTAWEHTKSFFGNSDVATAKEILEWLGLLSMGGGSVLGVFALVKKLNGSTITNTTHIERDGKNVVVLNINGDNNIVTYPQTLQLLREDAALESVKRVVQPLIKDGYETLEIEADNVIKESFKKEDAAAIVGLRREDIETVAVDEPQVITAWVTVYSPVYDSGAKKWQFKFGDIHRFMDISDTGIVENALKRGGAMVDDAYYVRLQIQQEHGSGKINNHYKILEVLDFKPAVLPAQQDAFPQQ